MNEQNGLIYNRVLYVDNNHKTIISTQQLNDLMKSDKTIYQRKLKGHLFCPDCEKLQLAVIPIYRTDNYYLQKYPNQSHSPTCIKAFLCVGKSSFDRFVNESNAVSFLNLRLNRIIETMLGNKINPKLVSLITTKNWRCLPQDELEDNINKQMRIQQLRIKHITAPMYNEYDNNVIYYGTVDLMFNKFKQMDCISLFKCGSEQSFCLLTMKNMVASEIRNKFNLEPNKRYNNILIAFITKMTKDSSFGMYGEIIEKEYLVLKAK